MNFDIIDTAVAVTPHLAELKAAGVRTVIRYLNPLNPRGEKCIKEAEARAIADAGMRLAVVCEGFGDFAHGGISAGAGERDGEWCAKYASQVGAADGACVYFAVDVDASPTQIRKLVLPYFASIATAFKGHAPHLRVGIYGSGAVCEAVTAAGLADLAWLSCSLGWRGSRDYLASNKWALCQHLPQHIAGIDADPNKANGEFGDFAPFASFPVAKQGPAAPQASQASPAAPVPESTLAKIGRAVLEIIEGSTTKGASA